MVVNWNVRISDGTGVQRYLVASQRGAVEMRALGLGECERRVRM